MALNSNILLACQMHQSLQVNCLAFVLGKKLPYCCSTCVLGKMFHWHKLHVSFRGNTLFIQLGYTYNDCFKLIIKLALFLCRAYWFLTTLWLVLSSLLNYLVLLFIWGCEKQQLLSIWQHLSFFVWTHANFWVNWKCEYQEPLQYS